MTVELYVPYKLQSEIERFKEFRGNINLDYRSDNVSTPHILDTSFIKLSGAHLDINAGAPFTITEEHVSGDNNNYRNFSTDFVVENNEPYQMNILVFSTLKNVVKSFYLSTTAIKIGPRNTLAHLFVLDEDIPATINLTPVCLSGVRGVVGIIDQKICERLSYATIPDLVSITRDGRNLTIVQESSVDNGHNVEINKNLVPSFITDISVFEYDNTENKSTSKLRLVSALNDMFGAVNPSPLSVLVPNYNLYYKSTSNEENSVGYCVSLKSHESILLNLAVQSGLETYTDVVPLGIDNILVSDAYTGGLNTYFASLKFELPNVIPVDSIGFNIPFRVMINGVVHKLPSYISTDFSAMCLALKGLLEPKGIHLYERGDNCLFLYGVNAQDVSITIAYEGFKITTEEDVSNVPSLYPQPELTYTESGYPPNLSLSYDDYIDRALFRDEGEAESGFYCFSLNMKSNPTSIPISGLLDHAAYVVDKVALKAEPLVFKSKDVTVNIDLTASAEATILTDLKAAIQPSLTNITVEVDEEESTLIFKNKLTTIAPFEVKFSPISVDPTYRGIYEVVEETDKYLLSGSTD